MNIRDFLGILLLASGWGPTFLLIKIGVESVSPLVLTTTRLFSAAIFLLAYCAVTKRSLKPVLPYWKDFLIMAILGNVIPFLFCAWGETMVQSTTAGIIEGTVPIFTGLLIILFTRHRKLPKEQLAGIVIGFLGILIIFAPDILNVQSGYKEPFLGKMLLMVMAISFAASFVFSKERLESLPHISGVTLQLILSSLILSILTVSMEGWEALGTHSNDSFLVSIVLGVYGTAFPWCVYFYLIKRGSAAQVSMAAYLLPVVAIFLGWFFLDEKLNWNLGLGIGVILFSLLLAGGMFSKRKLTEHDNPILKS